MPITEHDRSGLESLIVAGKLSVSLPVGDTTVEFNLANLGDESEAEAIVLRMAGGNFHAGYKKIAVLATNIDKIGSWDLSVVPLTSRLSEIGKLQPSMIDFLYDAYLQFRDVQRKKMDGILTEAKKSLSSQTLDMSTGS